MKIGLIVYGMERPITGIGRYTLEIVKSLAKILQPADVTLLVSGGLGPLLHQTAFAVAPLVASARVPGLMTIGQFSIRNVAQRLGLNVIHDPVGIAPLLVKGHSLAAVATIHDVFPWSYPGFSSLLDTLIYKLWLPRMVNRLDTIITVSQQSVSDISRYLRPSKNRVTTIPYGVNSIFKPIEGLLKSNNERYILFVGALTQRKNIERSLEAFARISKDFPQHHFVVTGPGSWKQTPIEGIVRRLGIADRIRLTGPLTDNDLPSLYSRADLFVFPSLYEGFGLPVLEAMACGTPVITSNVSSLPEVAGGAAILVNPYDVEAIANAMYLVLSQPALAAEMREKGLVQASQFTWERTARETIAVYEKVLNQR